MGVKNIIVLLAVTFGVLVGGAALLFRGGEGGSQEVADVAGERRHVKGSGEVEVVEFSDFQCPACRAAQAVVEDLLEEYGGQVSFVYRHFPLITIHPNAEEAAWAAEAASEQGKFWEMHDVLFARQDEWKDEKDPKERFISYAGEIGMGTEKFAVDYESNEIRERVVGELIDANKLKLQGTPSFFVNGIAVSTAQLISKVKELSGN